MYVTKPELSETPAIIGGQQQYRPNNVVKRRLNE